MGRYNVWLAIPRIESTAFLLLRFPASLFAGIGHCRGSPYIIPGTSDACAPVAWGRHVAQLLQRLRAPTSAGAVNDETASRAFGFRPRGRQQRCHDIRSRGWLRCRAASAAALPTQGFATRRTTFRRWQVCLTHDLSLCVFWVTFRFRFGFNNQQQLQVGSQLATGQSGHGSWVNGSLGYWSPVYESDGSLVSGSWIMDR